MRFALVETGRPLRAEATEATWELVLTTGERLRFRSGVDPAALRKVLEAICEVPPHLPGSGLLNGSVPR
jgi:hypothetical protein